MRLWTRLYSSQAFVYNDLPNPKILNELWILIGDLSVRLVGSASPHKGRVEIAYNGQWGNICDEGWNIDDAAVVCHQLGFNGAVSALNAAHFGRGMGPILMKDVRCAGNETYLGSCRHDGWGNTFSCNHRQDAGVVCSTGKTHGKISCLISILVKKIKTLAIGIALSKNTS